MDAVAHEYNTETLKFMYHFSLAQKDSNYFDKLKQLIQNFDIPPLDKPFIYSEIISLEEGEQKAIKNLKNNFEQKNLNISLLFEKKTSKKNLFANLKAEEAFLYLKEKKEKIFKKIDKKIDNLWVKRSICREQEFLELITEKIENIGLGFLVGGCIDVNKFFCFYLFCLFFLIESQTFHCCALPSNGWLR